MCPHAGDAVPSPNSYSLPILMGPHIPNRASSACYTLSARLRLGGFGTDYANTPGPGKYGRITPEVYQKKSPAYSILGRSFMPGGGCSHCSWICIYSGTPLIRTPMGPIAIVLISGVSAFQGVKIYSSNGDTFRSFRAKCPLNRGVRISEVRISGVPLYVERWKFDQNALL